MDSFYGRNGTEFRLERVRGCYCAIATAGTGKITLAGGISVEDAARQYSDRINTDICRISFDLMPCFDAQRWPVKGILVGEGVSELEAKAFEAEVQKLVKLY